MTAETEYTGRKWHNERNRLQFTIFAQQFEGHSPLQSLEKSPHTALPLSLGGATKGEKCYVKLDPSNKSFKCLIRDAGKPSGLFVSIVFTGIF